jgi:hypothetical protein
MSSTTSTGNTMTRECEDVLWWDRGEREKHNCMRAILLREPVLDPKAAFHAFSSLVVVHTHLAPPLLPSPLQAQ